MRKKRRRTIPTTKVVRALVLFFPAGLWMMWRRQCRWSLGIKAVTTIVTLLCMIGLWMGTLSIFPNQQVTRVQADTLQRWQKEQTLWVNTEGIHYHVEGCIHIEEGAVPIALKNAVKWGFSPDISCNPPSLGARN